MVSVHVKALFKSWRARGFLELVAAHLSSIGIDCEIFKSHLKSDVRENVEATTIGGFSATFG